MLEPTTQRLIITLPQLAKTIDHSLLHPALTDTAILAGLTLAKRYNVATACVKPYSIPLARSILTGTPVGICAAIGFPHGNSATAVKVFEAEHAVKSGAGEIDMVVNIGKVAGGEWDYVSKEIRGVNEAVVRNGGVLKVIFENGYLKDEQIVRLCRICSELSVGFVKTSTGYGFVKQDNGLYSYAGATIPHLRLMREHSKPEVRIKAAGGVRTLDDLLTVVALGATRVGATATVAILEEAMARGIGDEPVEIEVKMAD
jgi:deoxyribose-phosphate aldolase